ncbi:MAG TPA: C4-type zinc ribbon domain-containing protein [Candidatus Polarisedimenticolaceae bacterium]|nr:C4-type zinc ribbon domain-containing protein [Candidatus Polarisedimenticolaceae bacterium]
MSEARNQLSSLLKIQRLALEIQAARAVVDGAPARIEEAEARFRERNAEYVATKERYDAIEADRQARQAELATLEESRQHYQDSLMQVKNQREYAAALKEIDAVKAKIGEHEDAILKSMDEVDALKTDLAARSEHIESERAIVQGEHATVEAAVKEAHAQIERATAERLELEAALPPALVANVRRVEEGRKGLFLVKAEHESCSACHVRLRPQVYQEIKQATKLHICGNCRRYLYSEAAMNGTSPSTPSPAMEALNGGAA